MPFRSKDEDNLYELIKKGELDFSDEMWNEVSAQGIFQTSRYFRVDGIIIVMLCIWTMLSGKQFHMRLLLQYSFVMH